MIYITKRGSGYDTTTLIEGVYSVDCIDVDNEYKLFMAGKAAAVGIIINTHHLNIMNYTHYHSHMFESEYISREKKWRKIIKKWTIDKFIVDILKGKKLEFKEINRI